MFCFVFPEQDCFLNFVRIREKIRGNFLDVFRFCRCVSMKIDENFRCFSSGSFLRSFFSLFLRFTNMAEPSKLSHELVEKALSDSEARSLLLSLGSKALALLGSVVFSYVVVRYLSKFLDPTHEEKKRQKELAEIISKKMKLPKSLTSNFNEYELCVLADLINPEDINVSWRDIGGLDEMIDHVRQTVIYPLQHPELFNQSKLLTTPKGVLLYGPPGCGKTMLAKAIAKEAGANFINLQVK